MPRIKKDWLLKAGYANLHSPAVKAANTRAVVPYCVELQRRSVAIDATKLEKHMFKVIESIDALYKIVYSASNWLTDAELDAFSKHCRRIGHNWQMLAMLNKAALVRSWPCRPKLHYSIAHLPRQAALINPRSVQAYGSESMVGRVTKIYERSMDGPGKRIIQLKFMKKYLTGMLINWSDAL